ncbi:glycosyltransferase family 2 protein [Stenomitos frigidus]|uniref:Glycosyl transferase family A n=1 Tax=Stenomitos frigidus ULC18 TaxID=2107698 RepID=A0A2T1ECW6_9CYAN|nr:glycosyltransferase [Stenomitos frigidus]PSB30597.1 glycosyl transferase family A [Stenomitos frigidus ULC18]
MPTISIIVPVYNAEHTILETVTSVQNQSFANFELILVDDGSSDDTLKQLNAVNDPRVKVFSYENGGVSVARNRGIAHATGEFIAFLDHDDLWTPDKLELQLIALQQNLEAGVAYSWTCNMSEGGDRFEVGHSPLFTGDVYTELLRSNFIANGSNLLVRRQAVESVGGFDPTLAYCADWDFYLRLAFHWNFVVVPKPQVLYRQTSGSMSSKIDVLEEETLFVIDKMFQSAPSGLQNLKHQSLAIMYQYLAGMYLADITNLYEVQQAGQKLKMAIRLYPNILLSRLTQRYIIKCLIMQLFSPKVTKYFIQLIGVARNIGDPRLKHESH